MPSDDTLDLLTAYALDALEPEEVARVSELIEQDPELRALLHELRATADVLPSGLPDVALPADLRQKVLDHAVGRTARQRESAPSSARLGRNIRGWFAGIGTLAAAGFVAAIVAFGQLGALRGELDRTRTALDTQVALNQQVAAVVASAPMAVVLRGSAGSGTVLRDQGGRVVLAANLPANANGRVYQLWALDGSGAPVSIGTFTIDGSTAGLIVLPTNAAIPAASFAITDEPGPAGSSGPTTPALLSNQPSA